MKKRVLTLLLVVAMLAGAIFAVNAATSSDKLTANVTSKTVSTDTVLDLNGYSIGTLTVTNGAVVTVKDSKTDDYTVQDGVYGRITTVNGTVAAADGYLKITEADGTSFHRLTLDTTGVTLRANNIETDGASMYYQCTFGGDEIIKRNIAAYGVAMGANKAPDFADKTYTRNTNISGDWSVGKVFADNGTLLKGIMTEENTYSVNRRNASALVQNKAYVELRDGTRVLGSQDVAYSLRGFVETVSGDGTDGVNTVWDSMNNEQKDTLVAFRKAFIRIVGNWNMPRVDSYEVDGDAVELYTADDLKEAATKPYKNYILMNDIDMSGVEDYVPFGTFTGIFTGDGHTVSNLTVSSAAGDAMGMFGTVAENGVITDLHIEDITLNASTTEATNIGGIAGANNGSITGCTVTGVIKDTRTGTAAAPIYAGALAGTNNGTLTPATMTVTETLPDVLGNMNTYTTENLVARFGFKTADSDNVHTGLVGTGTIAQNLLWQDISYATKFDAAELQRRRQVVTDYVYEEGTIKWTPASTIRYYNDQKNNPNMEKPSGWWDTIVSGKWHIHNQTFNPGTTYIGIPYTHCSSSLEQAKYYMDLNDKGVYVLGSEITGIKGGANNTVGDATWTNGDIGWGKYLGTDCSSSLTVAWHKVSPIITSDKANKGVCLLYTTNMVPSQYNQWYYGFRQVGDYVVDDATWSGGTKGADVTAGGVTMNDYTLDTDDIMAKIGATGFYEAYAQSQMGDIAVAYSRTGKVGHARLIARDPVVIRNSANAIDPNKSYFVFHEQGAGLYVTPGVSSWRINWQCSFAEAALQLSGQEMGGNGNGYYLPITMIAFHDTTVSASGGLAGGGNVITDNNPLKWALNSSYRIQSATLIIKDANGNEMYNKTAFQGTSSNQARRRAAPGNIPLFASDVFSDACSNLTEGQTYYATFSGTTFPGITNTKMNNYEFVYDPAA